MRILPNIQDACPRDTMGRLPRLLPPSCSSKDPFYKKYTSNFHYLFLPLRFHLFILHTVWKVPDLFTDSTYMPLHTSSGQVGIQSPNQHREVHPKPLTQHGTWRIPRPPTYSFVFSSYLLSTSNCAVGPTTAPMARYTCSWNSVLLASMVVKYSSQELP